MNLNKDVHTGGDRKVRYKAQAKTHSLLVITYEIKKNGHTKLEFNMKV